MVLAVEALSPAERQSIQRELRRGRARIIAAWTASQFDRALLERWNVAGADQTAEWFQRSFVAPLFDLLTGWVGTGDHRWRAIYRDERLRYAPFRAPPADRARFFGEIIPRDEAAVLAAAPAELRDRFRGELNALHGPLLHPAAISLSILAVGDCIMNEIRVFLPDACRAREFEADVRAFYFSPAAGRDISTNQLREHLAAESVDLLAFSFLSYDGLPLYTALRQEADRLRPGEIELRATAIVGTMRRYLEELRELTDAPFLVHNASGLPLARFRRLLPILDPLSPGRRAAVDALNAAIAQLVEHTPNTILIDEMSIARSNGFREVARPAVSSARGALFHTARFGEHLAASYADVLASYEHLRRAKVLAVDFDNTLWDGVMADGPVTHHHDRQQLLQRAKEAGILLVAVSKNDPAMVRWNEMRLAPDDFVLQKVGWDLKVESLTSAAEQLDLGIDSFVFIDDNPAELEFVRTQLPQVRLLGSSDSFTWRSLERLLRFPNTKDTAESRGRTELYRQQARRSEALSARFDYPSMMAGLGLALEFRRAAGHDLDRVAELVQRTNQFNTSTRRYSRQQLQEFLGSQRHAVYVASLSDKFGKLGLVLTVLVEFGEHASVIDSFVMSCRAMGFQLEQAVLRLVLDTQPERTRWEGIFIPTDRNTPASGLFHDAGFTKDAERWVLPAGSPRKDVPSWFNLSSG